jgi:hypothetical protein
MASGHVLMTRRHSIRSNGRTLQAITAPAS